MHQLGYLKNKKNEEPTKSTGGMPAKDPSKVKSVIEESPITQKCKSLEISRTSRKLKFDVYIVVESWAESLNFGRFPSRKDIELLQREYI